MNYPIMKTKRGVNFVFLYGIVLLSLSFVSALEPFNITGYAIGISDSWTGALNATNVTIEIYQQNMGGPSFINKTVSVLSNESGYFNVEINGSYLSEDFSYKITLLKYNAETGLAEYIGPNLPYFPAMQIKDLGEVYFYLRPAITIDVSAIGPNYVTEEEDKVEYTHIGEFFNYSTGLSVLNNSGAKQYAYLNLSECLIVLNESFSLNYTACDLNITNIKDFDVFLIVMIFILLI